jgi:hypothetical protein
MPKWHESFGEWTDSAPGPPPACGALRSATDSGTTSWARPPRQIPGYQDSLPWHELVQVRVVAFQPVLVISSFFPLLCVAVTTVVEL